MINNVEELFMRKKKAQDGRKKSKKDIEVVDVVEVVEEVEIVEPVTEPVKEEPKPTKKPSDGELSAIKRRKRYCAMN
jgi:hypothetical protein